MASVTATERYSSPAVHHAIIAAKTTRDTTQNPTIKNTATSRATSTDSYLQGCPTGNYHQGCSTGHHHQGCSSRTATYASTSSTQEKVQEGQTITVCYKPYCVTHTFANDGNGSTHAGTTGDTMLGTQQINGGINDVHIATPSPTICKKNWTGPLPTKWADSDRKKEEIKTVSIASRAQKHSSLYTSKTYPRQ